MGTAAAAPSASGPSTAASSIGPRSWPIPRTSWTRWFLHPEGRLALEPPATDGAASFEALGDGATFTTPPLAEETEITGPSAAKLFVSSTTTDADLFLVLRVFDPDGEEVVLQGAVDPRTPVAQGWLRASHRKLDPERSTEYRPYHTHDEVWPLTGGDGRGGRRDLADEPDRAGRLPDRPHGSRARLRARRGRRRQPQPFPRERDARCGHLHARRPRRSPEGPLRRHDHRDDRWRHRVLDPGAPWCPRSSERPIWFEMEALCLARSGGGP